MLVIYKRLIKKYCSCIRSNKNVIVLLLCDILNYTILVQNLPKVHIHISKNNANLMINLSEQSLHKHGYRPYIEWGAMK